MYKKFVRFTKLCIFDIVEDEFSDVPDIIELDDDSDFPEASLPDWEISRISEDTEEVQSLADQSRFASPVELLNLCKMKHGMTDRSALSVLALLKLGLDFSNVRQADITKPCEILPLISEKLRCRTCAETLGTSECINQW
jgi:hypothetical protein